MIIFVIGEIFVFVFVFVFDGKLFLGGRKKAPGELDSAPPPPPSPPRQSWTENCHVMLEVEWFAILIYAVY